MPFAALRGWYLLLVQLARHGIDGDKASFLKFTNCRTKGLGSHIRGLLGC